MGQKITKLQSNDPRFKRWAGFFYSPIAWAWAIAACGILIRLVLSFSRSDAVWADETFQTLEPASLLVFKRGYLSWEWHSGYRSWIVPALYVPLLWLAKLLGISGGLLLIHLTRAFMVSLSVLGIFGFYRILVLLKLSEPTRLIALAAYCLAPSMALWSVTTLADHLLLIIIWFTLPTLLSLVSSSKVLKSKDWVSIGILCSLPVMIKIQALAWTAGLVFSFVRFYPIRWLPLWVGLSLPLVFAGMVDLVTWGAFYGTAIKQLTQGVGIAGQFGTLPWHGYLSLVWTNQGAALLLTLVILMGLNASVNRSHLTQFLKERISILYSIFLPLGLFVGVHCFVAHKETRFLLPVFPAFYLLLGILIQPLIQRVSSYLLGMRSIGAVAPSNQTRSGGHAAKHRLGDQAFFGSGKPGILIAALAIAGLVLASLGSLSVAQHQGVGYSSVNTAELESKIYEEGGLAKDGSDCIAFLDHHWSFTRGQMILGALAQVLDFKSSKVTEAELARCRYLILPGTSEGAFRSKASSGKWSLLKSIKVPSDRVYSLYRNQRMSKASP